MAIHVPIHVALTGTWGASIAGVAWCGVQQPSHGNHVRMLNLQRVLPTDRMLLPTGRLREGGRDDNEGDIPTLYASNEKKPPHVWLESPPQS